MVHTILYGPTLGFTLNLLPLDFHSRGILLNIDITIEKQQNNLFEKEWHTTRPFICVFAVLMIFLFRFFCVLGSLQTSLLCLIRELVGGGYVAVAACGWWR